MSFTGIFKICPIEGLDYETQTQSGRTGRNGEFCYQEGETVTFSAGGIVLGSAPAKEKLTPADLSMEVAGDVNRIINRKVTNITRLLMSLNPACDYEERIVITDEIWDICCRFRKKIYLNQPEDLFSADPAVNQLMEALAGRLVSPAVARNYLRRAMYGIVKKTDVKIPTRDSGYVLADIFMPETEGKYPVIISFGGYGKGFWVGKETNEEEQELHADAGADSKVSYPADQDQEILFVTEPMESDLVIAGYPMADLFVSSSSRDMKVLTYLYALDEDNEKIPFVMDLNPMTPLSKGGLKVSHRKLDEERTTEYRPYHTHLREDYQPLSPGEIAEARVEMVPMTAKIKKGWKLAFVIMANNEQGELMDPFDDYSAGAENTVYTGKTHPSYVQIPVIRDGGKE